MMCLAFCGSQKNVWYHLFNFLGINKEAPVTCEKRAALATVF